MDQLFKLGFAFGGASVSFLFGGWSPLLNILVAFIIMDYVTGICASGIEGTTGRGSGLSSKAGLKGIPKKVAIFVIVAVAHLVDTAVGDAHLFRDATVFFYLANELLSIIENAGRIGVPIPPFIKQAVEVLRGKGGDTDVTK